MLFTVRVFGVPYIYMDQFTLRHRFWKGDGTRPNSARLRGMRSFASDYLRHSYPRICNCIIVSRLGYLFAEKSHVTSLIRIAMIRGWLANNCSLMIAPTYRKNHFLWIQTSLVSLSRLKSCSTTFSHSFCHSYACLLAIRVSTFQSAACTRALVNPRFSSPFLLTNDHFAISTDRL